MNEYDNFGRKKRQYQYKSKNKRRLSETYSYHNNGKLKSKTSYFEGKIIYSEKFDTYGRIIIKIDFNEEETLKKVYSYDEVGYLIEITTFSAEIDYDYIDYNTELYPNYYKEQKEIKFEKYPFRTQKFENNEFGLKTEECIFGMTSLFIKKFEYDKYQNITKIVTQNSVKVQVDSKSIFKYKYDIQGNWIEKNHTLNDSLYEKTVRDIKFY